MSSASITTIYVPLIPTVDSIVGVADEVIADNVVAIALTNVLCNYSAPINTSPMDVVSSPINVVSSPMDVVSIYIFVYMACDNILVVII